MSRIRVGLIGVGAKGGWARRAHIPALKSVPDFTITAMAARDPANARDVASEFDHPVGCDDYLRLVERRDVDLVAVTVRVAEHRAVVDAALNAGKAVLCEWPLGLDAGDAESMATKASSAGLFNFVGLQARANPAVRYLKELVADGYVGELLSASVIASGMAWGDRISQRGIYTQQASGGATMLRITFGHTIDALCWCLGEFSDVGGLTAVRQPDVRVNETGEIVHKTAADQLAFVGRLRSGAIASVHFRGGTSNATNFLFEVKGSRGDLVLRSGGGQMQQASDLALWGAQEQGPLAQLTVPQRLIGAPDAPMGDPFNIAQAYVRIAQAMKGEQADPPTFADALIRHNLLEAFEKAADSGRIQRCSEW